MGGIVYSDFTLVNYSTSDFNVLFYMFGDGEMFYVTSGVYKINQSFLRVVTTRQRITSDFPIATFVGKGSLGRAIHEGNLSVYNYRFLHHVRTGNRVGSFSVLTGTMNFVGNGTLSRISFGALSFVVREDDHFHCVGVLSYVRGLGEASFLVRRRSVQDYSFLGLVFSRVRFFKFCYAIFSYHGNVCGLTLIYSSHPIRDSGVLNYNGFVSYALGATSERGQLVRSLVTYGKTRCLTELFCNGYTFLYRVKACCLGGNGTTFFLKVFLRRVGVGELKVWSVPVQNLCFRGKVTFTMFRYLQYSGIAIYHDVRNIGNHRFKVDRDRDRGVSVQIMGLRTYAYVQSYVTYFYVFLCSFSVTLGIDIISGMAMNLAILTSGRVGIFRRFAPLPAENLTSNVGTVQRVLYLNGAILIAYRRVALNFLYVFVTTYKFRRRFGCHAFFKYFGLNFPIVHVLSRYSVTFSSLFVRVIYNAIRLCHM